MFTQIISQELFMKSRFEQQILLIFTFIILIIWRIYLMFLFILFKSFSSWLNPEFIKFFKVTKIPEFMLNFSILEFFQYCFQFHLNPLKNHFLSHFHLHLQALLQPISSHWSAGSFPESIYRIRSQLQILRMMLWLKDFWIKIF